MSKQEVEEDKKKQQQQEQCNRSSIKSRESVASDGLQQKELFFLSVLGNTYIPSLISVVLHTVKNFQPYPVKKKMNTAIILLLLMFTIMVNSNTAYTVQPENDVYYKNPCHKGASFSCCEGYVLEVQNETTAKCINCIPAGRPCYQINRPCCPGYRCGSGPAIYVKPRPTDICIPNLLKG
ncbi:unnamed protein product [Rotaria socialis]|nr:unnamed protein product [Rotaria socialis]